MPLNLTNFDAVLKDDMLPGIKQLVPEMIPLLNRFKTRNARVTGGRRIENPALDTFSQAIGARSETGTLPTAGNDAYLQPVYNLKYHYGKVALTGASIRATAGDKFAAAKALTSATKNMAKSFLRDINREMYGDGLGAIAILPAADDQTTITCSLESAQYANPSTALADVRAFNLNGARVDLIDATDNATKLLDSRVISSFADAGSNTITLVVSGAAPTGTAAGDYFVREDALLNEFPGLAAIIDDANPASVVGNIGGISRATNDNWKAFVNNVASSPTLAESHIDSVIDRLLVAGGNPKEAWTTVRHQRQLAESISSNRRYLEAEKKIDAGFNRKAIFASGIPVYADSQATPGVVYLFEPDEFTLFQSQPGMHWRQGFMNSYFVPATDSTDSWEAVLIWDCVLVPDAPNHAAKVQGLSVTG